MRYTINFILVLLPAIIYAQDKPTLVFDNQTYDNRVQTVLFSKLGVDDRYPIITLNSSEKLQLSFDVLGNKTEYYQYTIVHCDANWKPTQNLRPNEYIQGMTFDQVSDIRLSTSTYVKFVHYTVVLPNENVKPVLAGNYLVKIYRNYDEDDLVLTRRMLVIAPSVNITGKAQMAQTAQNRFTKQEINFSINYTGYSIPNPFEDVSVVVMQNGRWDNALTGIKPLFIRDNVLDYNNTDQILFNGGNEFRFFDMRNIRGLSINVRSKTFDSVYRAILNLEESRGSRQYLQYIDNNGIRIIQNTDDGTNGDVDGDYVKVNFFLVTEPTSSDVYVFGEFSDWKLKPEYKLNYNNGRNRYELETLLKQGRYEYFYATRDESGKPSETFFEGSSSQAENEYLILVYHKNQRMKYDELVGARKFSSTM